ncbi:MAG: hypothetical protein JST30_06125 [Armatimonadetes bacterium]|nr:hypothetical protein [Armatimonadota bacterium]
MPFAPVLFTMALQQRGLTFETSLKSVAVFRDGYGYYVREGQVKLENGWATTNFVPSAIRGTVYVYALDKGDRIDEVITTRDNRIEFGNPAELKSKLADKTGLRLVVTANNGQRFEGELARLLDDMLLLQVGAGYSAVPYNQIQGVSLPGYPIRVKVDTKDPNKTTKLGIAYLQEGIRWEPSYVLAIDGGKANLQLRASMQNTTETLNKSDVLFVVGSPFVANRGVQDMVGVIAPQVATGAPAPESDAKRLPEAQPEEAARLNGGKATIAAEESGELYFYRKAGLSLATNDIAMVSIFQQDVPVSPSFEWNADGEDVLYILNLENVTKQPLTTGPVFVVEDGRAVGQETVKYTPAGGTAEIRLSRGIGMRVEKTESEVKRGAPVHIGKSDFIPVTLRGELKLSNLRGSDATVKIKKTVRGRIVSQSDGGSVRQTQVLTGEVNAINDLEWKVTAKAGQTSTVSYTFEAMVFADRSGTPPVPERPDGRP